MLFKRSLLSATRCLVVVAVAVAAVGCARDSDPVAQEGDAVLAGASACKGITKRAVSTKARDFMAANGLILPNEEVDQESSSTKWAAIDLVPHASACLVVMNLQGSAFGEVFDSELYEVIAVSKSAGALGFKKFEEVYSVPASMRVAIGVADPAAAVDIDGRDRWNDFYYGELTGDSALAASKTMAAGLAPKVTGLSAEVSAKNVKVVNHQVIGEPDGKLDWDPTPGRTWKLKNVTFSMRRGSTAEVLDLPPHLIDEDFAACFAGLSNGQLAPWAYSYLRRVWDGASWNELVPRTSP